MHVSPPVELPPPGDDQVNPYSLAYRLVRIVSDPATLDKRLAELKGLLLSREYRPRVIDAAIEKARAIPRHTALKKVVKTKNSKRVVFAITYDPRLPSISKIFRKHHEVLKEDPAMATIFPEPPLVAYRRPQSLRDKLVKSKVPEVPARPKREIQGIKKCLDVNCVTCPYVSPGKEVKCTATGEKFNINSPVSCDTENIIYCITCKRCQQQYVGQSGKGLGVRFAQHRGYVNNYFKHKEAGKVTQPTGEHFNSDGHQGVSDMDLKIIEKVFSKSEAVR